MNQIYRQAERLRKSSNQVKLIWTPAATDSVLAQQAKAAARASTEPGRVATGSLKAAKSTLISVQRATKNATRSIAGDVGRFTRRLDLALPGPHTQKIYDAVGRREASVLAQLRTAMARLNGYLYRIRATDTEQCICGHEKERWSISCSAVANGMIIDVECSTRPRATEAIFHCI